MNTMNFKNVVEKFLERIPEFKNTDYFDESVLDLPYLFFGNVARFLFDRIKAIENPSQDEIIVKAFAFLNEIFNSPKTDNQQRLAARVRANDKFTRDEMEKIGLELKNLFGIEFFEKFCESRKVIEFTKRMLKNNEAALKTLEITLQHYGAIEG